MLQPPPQWPGLPALPLPSVYVSWSRVSPLGGWGWEDELSWGQTLTGPWGPPHGCHLLAESQSATPVTGWEVGGVGESSGWGCNRCLLKPQGTSLKASFSSSSSSSPSSTHLYRSSPATGGVPIHPQWHISPLSVMWFLYTGGLWLTLTFTSELCRLTVGYVWFCRQSPTISKVADWY